MTEGQTIQLDSQLCQSSDQVIAVQQEARSASNKDCITNITSMLDQTHLQSMEELLNEDFELFKSVESPNPYENRLKILRAHFHIDENTNKEENPEAYRDFLRKCIEEKVIPDEFLIRIEPTIGNEDEQFMKEIEEINEKQALKLMELTVNYCYKEISKSKKVKMISKQRRKSRRKRRPN